MNKELKKLKRSDLLEIMVAQSKEVSAIKEQKAILDGHIEEQDELIERLKAKLDEKDEGLERLKEKLNEKDETIERLKAKLNDKDEQLNRLIEKLNAKDEKIDHLKDRLNMKDQKIGKLEAELAQEIENQVQGITEIGNLADVAAKISRIFEVAQEAADEYVKRVEKSLE